MLNVTAEHIGQEKLAVQPFAGCSDKSVLLSGLLLPNAEQN